MKLLQKLFWKSRRTEANPITSTPPALPKVAPACPVDISKLTGRDKTTALMAAAMQPERMDARRIAQAAQEKARETAIQSLHDHAVEQGKLASKRARESYFKLHRAEIDAALKASGENTHRWYATFLA